MFRKLSICTYLSITFTFSIHQHISSENRYCDIPNVRLHRKYSSVIFDLIRSNLIDNLDCSYKLHVVFQTGEHYLVYVIRNMLNKNMKLINTNMYSTYYIMAKQQQIMSWYSNNKTIYQIIWAFHWLGLICWDTCSGITSMCLFFFFVPIIVRNSHNSLTKFTIHASFSFLYVLSWKGVLDLHILLWACLFDVGH